MLGGSMFGTGFLIHRNLLHVNLPQISAAESAEIWLQNGVGACLFPHRLGMLLLDMLLKIMQSICGLASYKLFLFVWLVLMEVINGLALILTSVPKCGCGAGFCRRLCIDTSGTNVGRKYFACPIKKGQGACSFFKLIDGELFPRNDHEDERIISPQSTMMDHSDTSPAKSVQDGNFSHEGVEIESNIVETALYYASNKR